MSFSAIASYIRIGYPKEVVSESAIGRIYVYVGPTATINSNKPAAGETWADSRPVVSAESYEISAKAAYSELTVVTSVAVTLSGDLGTPATEGTTKYALRWQQVEKPLEAHPEFQSGGTYALDADAYACILGWRAELDPVLRATLKYRPLDSEGEPGAEVDIATESANAAVYLALVLKGVEAFVDFVPVWRKSSIYSGNTPPVAAAIGQVDTPSGPIPSSVTTAFPYWRKSADDVEPIGSGFKWRREEEWEGGKRIFLDRDDIFPTGVPS